MTGKSKPVEQTPRVSLPQKKNRLRTANPEPAMIHDDMIHGGCARSRPRARIELDTPIVPRAVAEAVWEEASTWLDEELPRSWIAKLSHRAEAVYTRNERFRRLLRQRGNKGRDVIAQGEALGFEVGGRSAL